ncbi:hypothetical protein DFH07DRAFT_823015 [Mycena maculata]|uniref:Uncharacterized protein n=1 Tax=Mycena maculata TaxID=230809 RepID=A0AAD7J081_9AGAR|nr:hypothetical protein DFH07DRAFT_823015 [Mycena maculata]
MKVRSALRSPLRSSAGSVSSVQSFDTVRQAPSTAATSPIYSDDQRWSQVVPPESGLTFAVVWDPEENGILSFSSAELAESPAPTRDPSSPDSPSDALDNRSQILTIGPSVAPASESTATLQYFRDKHDFLFAESPFFPDRRRTQTSSTLDGLDVYLRGSMLGRAHNANRYYSCFKDLDDEFAFDPRTSFANAWVNYMKHGIRDDVSDEGFFESGVEENEGNLSSRFSMTTTSTSNYITVENEVDDESSAAWSTVEAPNTPSYSRLLFTNPPASNHRLRKTRPIPGPASPSDVLARRDYNHNVSPPTTIPTPPIPDGPPARLVRSLSLPKFARKWKKADAPGWVLVDVKEDGYHLPPLPPLPPLPLPRAYTS